MGKFSGMYDRFHNGDYLTARQCIRAMCYDCNGGEESGTDCRMYDCPLYSYSKYNKLGKKGFKVKPPKEED